MSEVIVDGKIYEIVKDATTDIETVYGQNDMLQTFPILAVTGTGRSVENGNLYEIIWHLDEQDASLLSDDASDWVSDWGTADEAVELED
ncbi:hypothetical protein [Lacticaseibacillus saniviri]|uniref:Uncharacterized protein n=1 Tax=Lacticaseibacillus saniviri JCM 17471 = DSM 24301 TaxID=1293598 RepID=A0A0R2MSH8_9LACO|nr:hypothetical protein [Lacticaseibacillus saniviri]KRO16535.1 hypothetical protein IV56_GL001090 [Lacticaseibacillus saniviri JCM 17471 = DSM 24301]